MAHRVVSLIAAMILGALAHPVWAQQLDFAQQLTLSMPMDTEANQISVVVKEGLSSNAGLSDALRLARTNLQDGLEIGPAELKELAGRYDGLAAQRYVRLLQADRTATASDIAYYATIAVSTGRVWTLPDAIAAMLLLDPTTEPPDRIRVYASVIYAHAWAGNPMALDALIDLNGEGRLFGALSEATRLKIIEQDAANGGGRAVMRLALRLLSQPTRTPEEEAQLEEYLSRAAAVNNLAISVTATNLIAQRREPAKITVVSQ